MKTFKNTKKHIRLRPFLIICVAVSIWNLAPLQAAFVECFQPENPDNRLKAIYHSKAMNPQFYGFFRNGHNTITSGMEFSVNKEGERVLHSGERPMKIELRISQEYYADGIKPTGRHSYLTIGFENEPEQVSKYVCRTYRWLK